MTTSVRPHVVGEASDERPAPSPGHSLRWTAIALSVWSTLYLVPHIYWALGGEVGFSAVKPSATEHDQWQAANAAASVMLSLPILIAVGWLRSRDRTIVRAGLAVVTVAGASISAAHGLYGIVYRILNVLGVVEVDGQTATLAEHPWLLWDLLVIEPWFLIEGLLFVAVGAAAMSTSTARRQFLFACGAGTALATITGLLGLRVA